uniref:Out at first C-terminal domain-containing protein n=1 Tax=Timema genevievae TaxID=629358 RepID=A0A7R9K1U1_TIMGE|nr:unnamed protein product [Timema genevievae]
MQAKSRPRLVGASLSVLLGAVKHYPVETSHHEISNLVGGTEAKVTGRCLETADPWSPCFCHLELCIGWYPCGLKYCKGKGEGKSSSATGSYRCGIKTCKKCSLFSYYVRQKQLCLWDE